MKQMLLVLLAMIAAVFVRNNSVSTRQSSLLKPTRTQTLQNGYSSSEQNLPPLDSIIARNGTIIGDISFLLDFAIIAFPKSGTTFMKDYLQSSSETWLFKKEFCIKKQDDLLQFVKIYYKMHVELKQYSYKKTIKFGLKCPGVLYRSDVQIYRQYFPTTKLIIGLRHPVSWFESFYNYQSWRNVSMPPTTQLIGACTVHGKVCTDRARFHSALARLGLTGMESKNELELLFGSKYASRVSEKQPRPQRSSDEKMILKLPNPVFLYEVRQIHDKVTSQHLSNSIQQYLQINHVLHEIVPYTQNKSRAINICDSEHNQVRKKLVEHGRNAAHWIQNYFVQSTNVVVTSPDSLFGLLHDWRKDPCL